MPADADLDDQPVVRHLSWEYFKDLYERERELREAEVDALKAEIRHERELREQRMDMTATELALQAKEYERRLDDLSRWKEVVLNTLAEERGGRQRTTTLLTWGLAIVAVLSLALRFIGR